MIIYEFNTWGAKSGESFSVTPHEMVEKPRIYMGGGKRINKDEIDVLTTNLGCRMYRLDDDPEPYISAMLEHCKKRVEQYDNRLKQAKATLDKWNSIRKGVAYENRVR